MPELGELWCSMQYMTDPEAQGMYANLHPDPLSLWTETLKLPAISEPLPCHYLLFTDDQVKLQHVTSLCLPSIVVISVTICHVIICTHLATVLALHPLMHTETASTP